MAGPLVLIIDDEIDLAEALALTLEQAGYESVRAYSAREGIALAEARPPDLVVTDISLPDMDGWELIGRLKSQGVRRVLINSASSHAGEKLAAFGLVPHQDYVTKPFALDEFVDKVRALLESGDEEACS